MDNKVEAMSKEEQHAFTAAVKKLSRFARKLDASLFKKPTTVFKSIGSACPASPASPADPADAKVQASPRPQKTGLRPQVKLGILRLDYDYETAPGDIDNPQSFKYKVVYRAVPGLTFDMCQAGVMTPEVAKAFRDAVGWLTVVQKVDAITGDCGFMFWFQEMARQLTHKPVLLSSLVQLPAIRCAFARHEKIAIFTANSKTLMPMCELIARECGVNVGDDRFVIVGCEEVPGFDAVAQGRKVDVGHVQPGIVELARATVTKHPSIRAILLECTELPPYADALRKYLDLPVYDAITTADSFIDGLVDNPRFGDMDWREPFDGFNEAHALGHELDTHELQNCINCVLKLEQTGKLRL